MSLVSCLFGHHDWEEVRALGINEALGPRGVEITRKCKCCKLEDKVFLWEDDFFKERPWLTKFQKCGITCSVFDVNIRREVAKLEVVK